MACPPDAAAAASTPVLAVAPPSRLTAVAAVPALRRQARVGYPLPAVLALAVVAVLARPRSSSRPSGSRLGAPRVRPPASGASPGWPPIG